MNARARSHTRFVILAALLLVAGTGIAVAAIPGQGGAINGCYDTKKGDLRVIDVGAGQTCGKSEQALSWNVQGQQGVQGLPGKDGAKGDRGEPGPGLASVEDLDGLPCRVGKTGEGTLDVEYAPATNTAKSVSILCTSTTLHTLTVDHPTGGTVAGGAIDCGATCSAPYAPDGEVTLTATPLPGYVFSGWTGADACSGKGTCTLTLDSERQIGATFTRLFMLQVNLNLGFTGIVTKDVAITSQPTGLSPCTINSFFGFVSCTGTWEDGTQVTLTKTGSANVVGWTGCDAVTTNTCVVTMNSFRTVGLSAN